MECYIAGKDQSLLIKADALIFMNLVGDVVCGAGACHAQGLVRQAQLMQGAADIPVFASPQQMCCMPKTVSNITDFRMKKSPLQAL